MKIPKTIDEYMANFPPDVQKKLQKIRQTIKKAAPDAGEAIKYQIPTFTLNGNLIFFAGYKNHIGMYPAPKGTAKFNKELSAYRTSKATVRFPLDKSIPYGLITQIVKFRIDETLAAKSKKK
jgi:uncharacterized protein YdhG (YjbR/CyaY superfamily)